MHKGERGHILTCVQATERTQDPVETGPMSVFRATEEIVGVRGKVKTDHQSSIVHDKRDGQIQSLLLANYREPSGLSRVDVSTP